MDPVVIISAVRTPIGKYGGALKDVPAVALGEAAVRGALDRSRVAPDAVDELIFGHARQAGSGPNPARQVAHRAGLPDRVPAYTINKACGSGLQAVALAYQAIALGEASVVVAGGMESMSRMPYMLDPQDARWGHRMGNFPLVDAMYRDGFLCPLSGMIMGETAEKLARAYHIGRAAQDAFALESQQRASRAIATGRFRDEIVPVPVAGPRGETLVFDTDEHPRAGATLEGLAKLPPVFSGDGTVTAGNSSGITDGASALVVTTARRADVLGAEPLARIVAFTSAGVDPSVMGIGPVPALRRLFERTGLTADGIELMELNEAFAAQVLAVLHDVPYDPARLNVNGGAIALGHPIGCTGARIVTTLVHEMRKRAVRRGVATLCISGGMGMAMLLERP